MVIKIVGGRIFAAQVTTCSPLWLCFYSADRLRDISYSTDNYELVEIYQLPVLMQQFNV